MTIPTATPTPPVAPATASPATPTAGTPAPARRRRRILPLPAPLTPMEFRRRHIPASVRVWIFVWIVLTVILLSIFMIWASLTFSHEMAKFWFIPVSAVVILLGNLVLMGPAIIEMVRILGDPAQKTNRGFAWKRLVVFAGFFILTAIGVAIAWQATDFKLLTGWGKGPAVYLLAGLAIAFHGIAAYLLTRYPTPDAALEALMAKVPILEAAIAKAIHKVAEKKPLFKAAKKDERKARTAHEKLEKKQKTLTKLHKKAKKAFEKPKMTAPKKKLEETIAKKVTRRDELSGPTGLIRTAVKDRTKKATELAKEVRTNGSGTRAAIAAATAATVVAQTAADAAATAAAGTPTVAPPVTPVAPEKSEVEEILEDELTQLRDDVTKFMAERRKVAAKIATLKRKLKKAVKAIATSPEKKTFDKLDKKHKKVSKLEVKAAKKLERATKRKEDAEAKFKKWSATQEAKEKKLAEVNEQITATKEAAKLRWYDHSFFLVGLPTALLVVAFWLYTAWPSLVWS